MLALPNTPKECSRHKPHDMVVDSYSLVQRPPILGCYRFVPRIHVSHDTLNGMSPLLRFLLPIDESRIMAPLPVTALTLRTTPFLPRQRSLPVLPYVHQNWPVAGHFHHNGQLLHRFLPVLAQSVYRYSMSPDVAAQQLAHSSTQVVENGGIPGLSITHLGDSYGMILQYIQRFGNDYDVSAAIRSLLEDTFYEDERLINHGRQYNHMTDLLYFRALAEISRQTDSLHIGHILSSHFLAIADAVFAQDDEMHLCLWAHAIHSATMQTSERMECNKVLFDYGPAISDSVRRYGGPHFAALERDLLRIAGSFGISSLEPRGRDYRSTRRRRYLSPSISPYRHLDRYGRTRRALSRSLNRSSSLPGDRDIVRQADRVIDAAEEMRDEAEELRQLAIRR